MTYILSPNRTSRWGHEARLAWEPNTVRTEGVISYPAIWNVAMQHFCIYLRDNGYVGRA